MKEIQVNRLQSDLSAEDQGRSGAVARGLSWLRKVAAPPIFEDEETTRVAGLLNIILISNFALVILSFLILLFVEPVHLVGRGITGFLTVLDLLLLVLH